MIQQKIRNDLEKFRQEGNPGAKILASLDSEFTNFGKNRQSHPVEGTSDYWILDDDANKILQKKIRLALVFDTDQSVIDLLSRYVIGPELSDEELMEIIQEVKETEPKKILKFLRKNYGSEININVAHERICGMIGVRA